MHEAYLNTETKEALAAQLKMPRIDPASVGLSAEVQRLAAQRAKLDPVALAERMAARMDSQRGENETGALTAPPIAQPKPRRVVRPAWQRKAAEAQVEMASDIATLCELLAGAEERERAGEERERAGEKREKLMVKMTAAALGVGGLGSVAAVVALFWH